MESPPLARYIPHKAKKRVFPGASSSCMDPDVIEIYPPINGKSRKSLKQKEVIIHEIIDVDLDEDCGDVTLIDGKVERNGKGKEALTSISLGPSSAGKVESMDGVHSLTKSCAPGSQNVSDLDCFGSDLYNVEDDYMDMYVDDYVYEDDDYEILQSRFDHIDLPPGIEATIPWLPDPDQIKSKLATASYTPTRLQKKLDSTGSQRADSSPSVQFSAPVEVRKNSTSKSSSSLQLDLAGHFHMVESPRIWSSAGPSRSKKIPAVSSSSIYSSAKAQKDALNVPVGMKPFIALHQSGSSRSKRLPSGSGGASNHSTHNQLGSVTASAGVGPFINGPSFAHSSSTFQVGNGIHSTSNLATGSVNPLGVEVSISKWKSKLANLKQSTFLNGSAYSGLKFNPFDPHGYYDEELYVPSVQDPANQKSGTEVGSSSSMEDVLKKFEDFKKFDTVEDHSDHHYSKNSSSKQPSKNWAKKIQDEWRILEKDLPDTILVRVYESRMDLLRAVIVGAEGTPYHDGLFFFDVFFPGSYPSVPPLVYYHSGGLRINPNLYNCGKVCLSLLNTWSGGQREKWLPGTSTMLQVLVSIQGLILNAKPYFNEPGYAHSMGSVNGEKSSLNYNENTFILSLKTMVYAMRKPPKYFEDFVVGHYTKRARDILVACKAYTEGAQVGCLVRGGVQDVDEGDKSCSQAFKDNVALYITTLVNAFAKIGVKGTEEFHSIAQKRSPHAMPMPSSYYHY